MRNEPLPVPVAAAVTTTFAEPEARRPAVGEPRWAIVDLLRGLAIVAVVAYHFVWDLGHFGVIAPWAHTPTGRWVGHLIAGTFLFLAGFSLVLAHRHRTDLVAFGRRLGKLLLCAYAITAVSLIFAPSLVVTYGILHDIALTTVLLLPVLRAPRLLVGGAVVLAAVLPMIVSIDSSSRWVTWTGLTPALSPSLDVQPLLPGLAVSLAGVLLARSLTAPSGAGPRVAGWRPADPVAGAARLLGRWGRHTLAIYLLHQPLLFGGLMLARRFGFIG